MQSNLPLVSIIVLNYNGKQHLKTCLESLLETNYPNFEIILVDNGSSDGSVEFVAENYPKVKIVKLKRNIYTVGSYMAGVMVAKGKHVAILKVYIQLSSFMRITRALSEVHRGSKTAVWKWARKLRETYKRG